MQVRYKWSTMFAFWPNDLHFPWLKFTLSCISKQYLVIVKLFKNGNFSEIMFWIFHDWNFLLKQTELSLIIFLLKKQLVAGDKMRTFHQKAIITCQFSVFVVTTGFWHLGRLIKLKPRIILRAPLSASKIPACTSRGYPFHTCSGTNI
jgi:hypothetical protein